MTTQLSKQISSKLNQDSGLQGKSITVQTKGGVVTLSGTVDNDMQRAAASNYASTTPGIKVVVNNLQTAAPAVPAASQMAEAVPVASAPPDAKPQSDVPRHRIKTQIVRPTCAPGQTPQRPTLQTGTITRILKRQRTNCPEPNRNDGGCGKSG